MLQKSFHLIEALFQITTEFYAKTIPRKSIKMLLQKTGIVAHRGVIAHPIIKENTMAAFRECLKKNIWAIEFDIRWTKDLIPVVHHDPDAIRVWNKGLFIHEVSFEQLRQEIPEIPTLSEVVEEFGEKLHLMVEVKKLPEFNESQEKTAIYNLNQALQSLLPEKHYHFMSFQPEDLIERLKLPSKSILSIVTTNIESAIHRATALEIKGLTGHFALITPRLRKLAKVKNLKIGVGFVNSKNSLFRELTIGTDYIYSNRPFLIQELLNKIPFTNAQQ